MGGMVGGGVRVRQDIWAVSAIDEWHPTIRWYEHAFRQLRDNTHSSDPLSLEAIANIHGTDTPQGAWPAGVGQRTWDACQHFSWFFLPWHRMYLHYYESILRSFVDAAHGPADWALPFWDYHPARPETLALPPAFRQPQRPGGGDNALYRSQRRAWILAGDPVPATHVDLAGWPDRFTSSSMFVPTFGGPKTGWNHDTGNAMGHVENIPHGAVHVDVGGLMGRFETAGQDAIFWLHHANIDRLWEVWRSQPGHVDPTDAQWLDETFDLGFGNAELSMAVSQVLDTSASPLQYVYDGVAAVVPAAGGGFALDEGPVPPEDIEPTLVGATEQEVPIGADRAEVTIGVEPAGGLGLDEEAPKHVYVVLQNVKATTTRDRTYAVHVGVPEGEDPAAHPQLLAGRFSTFGVVGATKTGAGLTVSFDVTPIVQALGLAGQAPGDLRVTVTPIEDGPDDDAALGLDDASDLRIGQIGVFFG